MANSVYPPASRELSQKRRALAPDIEAAFDAFSQRVFADGALPAKTKQVISRNPCAINDSPGLLVAVWNYAEVCASLSMGRTWPKIDFPASDVRNRISAAMSLGSTKRFSDWMLIAAALSSSSVLCSALARP